jgi:sulfite exporter TauE/SafE
VSALLVSAATIGPAMIAALPRNLGPYATLMLLGFFIGIVGHIFRSRWLVAIGVLLIFIGAFLLPLALKATTNDEPPPPPHAAAGPAV